MKTIMPKWSKVIAVAVILLAGIGTVFCSTLGEVDVHDRVGKGWHMYTTAKVDDSGVISGETTLKNYNNFRGYTGGLFVVAVDDNLEPIYTSDVYQWGINAAGFRKKRTRDVSWQVRIPAEILPRVASFAIIQQHTPTKRVAKWVYNNRQLIFEQALRFIGIFLKARSNILTADDIWDAVNGSVELLDSVESDSFVIEHINEINNVAYKVYQLAMKKENGWIPENADDARLIADEIVELTRQKLNWNDLEQLRDIISRIGALVADKDGWIPDNLEELQVIIENIYEMMEGEAVPAQVKEAIAQIIAKMDKVNE